MNKTPPNKIYLQWNCDENDEDWGNPEPGDITWCPESIFSDDVAYFRIGDELIERLREEADHYYEKTPAIDAIIDLLAIIGDQ